MSRNQHVFSVFSGLRPNDERLRSSCQITFAIGVETATYKRRVDFTASAFLKILVAGVIIEYGTRRGTDKNGADRFLNNVCRNTIRCGIDPARCQGSDADSDMTSNSNGPKRKFVGYFVDTLTRKVE